jgi:glutamate-ammonia-ligase adenylyltransferase
MPHIRAACLPAETPEAAIVFAGTPFALAAASAAANAPYLRRLLEVRADLCVNLDADWPERIIAQAMADARALELAPTGMDEGMRVLRRAKQAVHLGLALADLARRWPLDRITAALTDFADASLQAALSLAVREARERGDLEEAPLSARGPAPGYALIAMGKMGAHELNYSSDIDISVFYDPELLPVAHGKEARVIAVRLVAGFVRAMEEKTEDGYVFRMDLRLRPDPGSTPPAVSLPAAEHYYQSLGQNWERAAFIKARAAAGDRESGVEFLASLQSFIWRKHLDFAAVADVESIKRQILSTHKSAELSNPVFDVKLGRGGIRDIELFVQTQQLILGGRNRTLRQARTMDALDALREAGAISEAARDTLKRAYVFFREVEHRIQMLEDEQTQRIPADPQARARLASLCGYETLEGFEHMCVSRRKIVTEIDRDLFERGDSLADPIGSLVFTGVEDSPETLETIGKLGFSNPALVSQTIRGWHHGRIRAMRAERARELLTELTPRLLRAFSLAGDPDRAFARFVTFFSGLQAGVLVLSLFAARPQLLDMLARLFGLAPRLADILAKRPALIDSMIEPRFMERLENDEAGARFADLGARLNEANNFEAAINFARRFHREEAFRIGFQVLENMASAEAAGAAYANLAEACVEHMAAVALKETERLYGPAPGAFSVLALGKFGGRELAEGSDLDVMIVYEAPKDLQDGGAEFYTRFTQRLLSALAASTEEGQLYDIDMQLRPSGKSGPVAVRFSAFERYYSEDAWTWELLALTRLRAVAGDASFGARIEDAARTVLSKPRDARKLKADAADMRGLMERERPGKTVWDVKLAPGGLVDLEFLAQTLQLIHAPKHQDVLARQTGEAFARLAKARVLSAQESTKLVDAWTFYSNVQHGLRLMVEGEFDPKEAAGPTKIRLAALAGTKDFPSLKARLAETQSWVRAVFLRMIGPLHGPLSDSDKK